MAVMGGVFAWLIGIKGVVRIASIFLLSQAAKYIPGRVWGLVAQRVLMGGQARLSRVLAASVAMAAILFASQLAMAVSGLLLIRVGAALAFCAGFAICLLAGATAALLHTVHAAMGWRLLTPWAGSGVGVMTGGASFVSLLLTGLAWAILFGGGLGYARSEAAHWISVSGFSYLAGMASLLPSGLGLREAAFTVLGGQWGANKSSDAPMLALVTRIWLLAIDGLAVLLGGLGVAILQVKARR